jgi:branched-chain amino acid transport system substrate-binding protein
MPRLAAIATACALGFSVLLGCGEDGGEARATLTAFVSAPQQGPEGKRGRRLCREARAQAARDAGGAGSLKLRVVCLDASGRGGDWTLAQVGANARRASEDSTTVAYLGEPDPGARRQSGPILEAAGIAQLGAGDGGEALAKVRAALGGATGNFREEVLDAVGG